MNLGLIFGTIGIICGFALVCIGVAREKASVVIAGIFFVIFNVCNVRWNFNKEENYEDNKDVPQAIDVYRGNTTLQITYKDSVAVDSVVVWK